MEFEVLEPATVSFPEHVKQLIIINRAPITLDMLNVEGKEELEPELLVMLDTAITKNTFIGLLELLQESPIEQFHTPIWLSDRRADTTSMEDLILTKREVGALCEYYHADAIVSLEDYKLGFEDSTVLYSDIVAIQTHYYEVSNKINWIIYLPESPRPFDSYSTADTMFFADIINGASQPVPSNMDMIRQLFLNSGKKYGRYLVPVWSNATRLLYKGRGDSLKLASKYTAKGEWDQAYAIWETLLNSGDSTIVAKALNNMAIYHELEDDLDSASLFLNKALQYDTLEVVKSYQEEMDIRILNRDEVLKQVR